MALTEKLTVYDTTLGQVLRFVDPLPAGQPKPPGGDKRYSAFDGMPLTYIVELSPQAYRVLQENPLLKQKIQLDMIGVGKKIVTEKIFRVMSKPQPNTPLFRRRVEGALKEGEKDVAALIDSVLKRHAEMNKAWGDYYKSMRKDMIFMVIGFALTATGLALSVPTGGASLALAIAGGAKSIAAAVNKLGDAWRTAEEQQKRLYNSITALLKAYVSSVHRGRAMQIGGALLDTIGVLPVAEMLPFVKRQLMPSLVKIRADMAVYKGKLGSLYEAANRLAAQLFDLLDKIDEWKKNNPGGVMPNLHKIERRIAELLDSGVRMARFRHKLTISGAYSRYENGMVELEKLEAEIAKLNNIEKHPRAVAIIGGAIKVFGNLAFTGAGYSSGANFDGVKDIGSFTSSVSNDLIGTVNDFVEFGETARGEADPVQVQAVANQVTASYRMMAVPHPPRPPAPTGGMVSRPPNRPPPPPPLPGSKP